MDKKIPVVVLWLFLMLCSAGFLVGAKTTWDLQNADFARGSTTMGTVVELGKTHRASFPVVEFATSDGERHAFAHPHASNPPAYQLGQQVEVLYQADDPVGTAVINAFVPKYHASLALVAAGLVAGLIGVFGFVGYLRTRRMRRWLRTHGRAIQAGQLAVDLDRTYKVAGRHPFLVRASWEDPATGEMHHFQSESTPVDLDLALDGRETITVYMDPDDPGRYWIDIDEL